MGFWIGMHRSGSCFPAFLMKKWHRELRIF